LLSEVLQIIKLYSLNSTLSYRLGAKEWPRAFRYCHDEVSYSFWRSTLVCVSLYGRATRIF